MGRHVPHPPGEGLTGSRALRPAAPSPRLTEPPFSLPGGMADSPREGKLARGPDFTQLADMACESVGGKVSGGVSWTNEGSVYPPAEHQRPLCREPA